MCTILSMLPEILKKKNNMYALPSLPPKCQLQFGATYNVTLLTQHCIYLLRHKSKCEMIIAIYDWHLDYYLNYKMLSTYSSITDKVNECMNSVISKKKENKKKYNDSASPEIMKKVRTFLIWFELILSNVLIFIISTLNNAFLEIIQKKKQYVQKSSSHAIKRILIQEKQRQREYYKQNSSCSHCNCITILSFYLKCSYDLLSERHLICAHVRY